MGDRGKPDRLVDQDLAFYRRQMARRSEILGNAMAAAKAISDTVNDFLGDRYRLEDGDIVQQDGTITRQTKQEHDVTQ